MDLQDLVNSHVAKQQESSQEQTNEETQASSTENTENSSLNTETTESSTEQTEEIQTEQTSTEGISTEETTSESSTESPAEVAATSEESTEEQGLTPDEFIEYILSETEGNDELRGQILTKFGGTKNPFANEQIAQLNKFTQETGRGINDYLFIQSLDTENMDSKSAVMQSLALDNPELNAEELNILFDSTYTLDEDEHTDKQIAAAKVKLKVDGKKSINRLNELKSEWQKPIPQQSQQEAQSYLPDGFSDVYANEISDIDSFEFELNDKGEKFNFKLDDNYGKSVGKFNSKDPLYRFRDAQGNIDAYAMAEQQALVDNIDSIVKSAFQQGLSQGMEKSVVDKKNLTINQENRPPAEEPKKTKQQEQVAKVLKDFLS